MFSDYFWPINYFYIKKIYLPEVDPRVGQIFYCQRLTCYGLIINYKSLHSHVLTFSCMLFVLAHGTIVL